MEGVEPRSLGNTARYDQNERAVGRRGDDAAPAGTFQVDATHDRMPRRPTTATAVSSSSTSPLLARPVRLEPMEQHGQALVRTAATAAAAAAPTRRGDMVRPVERVLVHLAHRRPEQDPLAAALGAVGAVPSHSRDVRPRCQPELPGGSRRLRILAAAVVGGARRHPPAARAPVDAGTESGQLHGAGPVRHRRVEVVGLPVPGRGQYVASGRIDEDVGDGRGGPAVRCCDIVGGAAIPATGTGRGREDGRGERHEQFRRRRGRGRGCR